MPRTRRRAAASSSASGMPSSRAQTSATAAAFCAVTRKSGCAVAARSTNSRTASHRVSASAASAAGGSRGPGSDSEGTRKGVSPATPSSSRLVASTRTPGQPRRRASARRAAASTRCSQLSSTRSRRLGRSASESVAARGRPASSRTPRAAATAWGARAGSARGASSTSHTPSGYAGSTSAAARRARRVLPTPPAPVSVTRRWAPSSAATAASSRSRPTKLVSCRGRLFGSASSVRSGGNAPGRSGCSSW